MKLSPSDADIVASHTTRMDEAKQEARKMNMAVLAEIAAANNEENNKENNKETEKPTIVSVDILNNVGENIKNKGFLLLIAISTCTCVH